MTSLGPINRDALNNFIVNSALNVQYGFAVGFLLGGYAAGQRAALQFLAENQHEKPKTRAQALLYHRNKNYRMMAAFGTGGFKRGVQLATVGAAYSLIKKSLEISRSEGKIPIKSSHFDDLISGTLIGSSLFLLSNHRQRIFHLKRGFLLGSSLGASLSLMKYLNFKFMNRSSNLNPIIDADERSNLINSSNKLF